MIIAILQARMSSTRLPGKVLKPIVGQPMIALQIQRLKRAGLIDKLVVATSANPEDQAIVQCCQTLGIACFQGSLANVLDRYYQAARQYQPAHVVRLTADCPLTSPTVIDQVIALHLEQHNDYTSNTLVRRFPQGLDVEVMTFSALQRAWKNVTTAFDQEHVTPYLYADPARFKLGCLHSKQDLSQQRWTVDNPEDFALVEFVYQHLYPFDEAFDSDKILALLAQHPEVYALNRHYIHQGPSGERE